MRNPLLPPHQRAVAVVERKQSDLKERLALGVGSGIFSLNEGYVGCNLLLSMFGENTEWDPESSFCALE